MFLTVFFLASQWPPFRLKLPFRLDRISVWHFQDNFLLDSDILWKRKCCSLALLLSVRCSLAIDHPRALPFRFVCTTECWKFFASKMISGSKRFGKLASILKTDLKHESAEACPILVEIFAEEVEYSPINCWQWTHIVQLCFQDVCSHEFWGWPLWRVAWKGWDQQQQAPEALMPSSDFTTLN